MVNSRLMIVMMFFVAFDGNAANYLQNSSKLEHLLISLPWAVQHHCMNAVAVVVVVEAAALRYPL